MKYLISGFIEDCGSKQLPFRVFHNYNHKITQRDVEQLEKEIKQEAIKKDIFVTGVVVTNVCELGTD